MKNRFNVSMILFCLTFFSLTVPSVESVQAAAPPGGPSVLNLVEVEDMIAPGKKADVWEYVGIGKMRDKIRSPIQTLAEAAKAQGDSGGIGGRLRKVMSESSFNVAEVAFDENALLATEIIGGSSDIDSEASDQGRMYPPRLEVNFQAYPTYAMNPAWTEQQLVRLNKQLQTKLNNGSQKNRQDGLINGQVELVKGEQGLVLQGTVSTEREKNVLEHYFRMEPGIKSLKNELVVRPVGAGNLE